MAAMLHGKNNRSFPFSYGEKIIFLMQNISVVPAMQHGCRAEPLVRLKDNAITCRT